MNKDIGSPSTSEKVVRAHLGANASNPPRIEQPLSKHSEILSDLRSALHEFLDESAAQLPGGVPNGISEASFKARYGFVWGARARQALLRFQDELDLSDREVRLFHRTGNLQLRSGNEIVLTANRYLAAFGRLQILGILLVYGTMIAFAMNVAETFLQAVVLMGVASGVCAVAFGLHKLFVEPWEIKKRAMPTLPPDRLERLIRRLLNRLSFAAGQSAGR